MKQIEFGAVVLGLIAVMFGCSSGTLSGEANGESGNPNGGSGAGNVGASGAIGISTGGTHGGGTGNSAGTATSGTNSGGANSGGAAAAGATSGGTNSGGTNSGGADAGGTTSGGTNSGGAAGQPAETAGAGGGLGSFTGLDFGAVSDGGTVTFQNIGAVGSYPSVCAPNGDTCCRQTKTIASDQLTPWDQDLILSLRGPLDIKQFAAYQPTIEGQSSPWQLVSSWDVRDVAATKGVAFTGNATKNAAFSGVVASTCLVNASTDRDFGCGPTSNPYCAASSDNKYQGWAGSKLFVFLASAPHLGSDGITSEQNCQPISNGWNDAPWIGLSVGELIRSGAFSACQCYEVTQYQGDGCGQINALEVINDNDTSGNYKNLEIFSSNFFGYGGDFGGPCGTNNCNTSNLAASVDLVTGSMAATTGALGSQTPRKNPNGFLRRPTSGYRYFVLLLDVTTRTVQYALVHPGNVPPVLSSLLPNLPQQVPQSTIDNLIQLRLPH